MWYGAKGGRSILARASDDDLLRPPGDERGPGLWTRANARGYTRAVAYDVPAPCKVSALWTMMYPPFPLYMHCGLWRNRLFHCTCTVVYGAAASSTVRALWFGGVSTSGISVGG